AVHAWEARRHGGDDRNLGWREGAHRHDQRPAESADAGRLQVGAEQWPLNAELHMAQADAGLEQRFLHGEPAPDGHRHMVGPPMLFDITDGLDMPAVAIDPVGGQVCAYVEVDAERWQPRIAR